MSQQSDRAHRCAVVSVGSRGIHAAREVLGASHAARESSHLSSSLLKNSYGPVNLEQCSEVATRHNSGTYGKACKAYCLGQDSAQHHSLVAPRLRWHGGWVAASGNELALLLLSQLLTAMIVLPVADRRSYTPLRLSRRKACATRLRGPRLQEGYAHVWSVLRNYYVHPGGELAVRSPHCGHRGKRAQGSQRQRNASTSWTQAAKQNYPLHAEVTAASTEATREGIRCPGRRSRVLAANT